MVNNARREALKRACELCEGQSALGKIIGVKQQIVWDWLNTTKDGVSPKYVIAIERATKGLVTRHELRPDLYPLEDEPLQAEGA